MLDYEIKIAGTAQEKEAAFKLRFEVFRNELKDNSDPAPQVEEALETDKYDETSDQLIVIDRAKNLAVGAYRLLLASKVDPRIGFYSEKIFDIGNIKRLSGEKLELSRSCVLKEYRESPVINLLWTGIAKYIKDNRVRYLFGSVRLGTREPLEINETFSFIRGKFYAPEELRVYPRDNCLIRGLKDDLEIRNPKETFLKLPALVKGYFRLGVKVCSSPARNPDFGSIVLFVLLDMEKASGVYKKHFLGL